MRGMLALLLLLPAVAFAQDGTQGQDTLPGSLGTVDTTGVLDAWQGDALPWPFPEKPSFAEGFCDSVVDPAAKTGSSTPRLRPGMAVCVMPGTFETGWTLNTTGLRLVALEPGTVMIKGDVVLQASAVLAGLTIEGDLLVHAGARGSVLLGNHITGAAVSETAAVVMIANTLQGAESVKMLSQAASPAFHVPNSALQLHVTLKHGTLNTSTRDFGDAVGWVAYEDLVHNAQGTTGAQIKPSTRPSEGVPSAKSGGAWSPTRPGELAGPDRLKNWLPIYGSIAKQDEAAVVVPLETGPWGPHSQAIVVAID